MSLGIKTTWVGLGKDQRRVRDLHSIATWEVLCTTSSVQVVRRIRGGQLCIAGTLINSFKIPQKKTLGQTAVHTIPPISFLWQAHKVKLKPGGASFSHHPVCEVAHIEYFTTSLHLISAGVDALSAFQYSDKAVPGTALNKMMVSLFESKRYSMKQTNDIHWCWCWNSRETNTL